MNRLLPFVLLAPFVPGVAVPALAQDEPAARLSGRSATLPPLSSRAMPAAPTVHRLSIGPLSNTPLSEAPAASELVPSRALPKGGELETASPATAEPADNSVEALVQRAKHGDADANYRLGLRYLAGDGVTRDLVEAFARIRLAAEHGHPRAISLFYTLGAKLTADEHGQAYDRSKKLRPAKEAAR